MQVRIIPESVLQAHAQRIKEVVMGCEPSLHVNFNDPDYGSAFAYYLLFSHYPSVGEFLSVALNDREQFYNQYYWFQRFISLYMSKHGYDAGLEQQAFQMLEQAGFDLDFEIIDYLDKTARGEH